MSKIYVIGPINEDAYRAFSEEVDKLLIEGAQKAQHVANEVLHRVRTKLGFL